MECFYKYSSKKGVFNLPTCKNCQETWSWKQTIKLTSTLNPAIKCPYCGKTQYQTQKSKMKISLLTIFILLPLLINLIFNVSAVFLLSSYLILFILIMILYPFIVELSNTEEYIDFYKD